MGEGEQKIINIELTPRLKLWLENEQRIAFGDGGMVLLQAIDECGSINQAAAKLNMSYRAAWGKLKVTEQRLGFKVINKHIGGTASGSELTPEAKKLMAAYAKYKAAATKAVESIFLECFGDL